MTVPLQLLQPLVLTLQVTSVKSGLKFCSEEPNKSEIQHFLFFPKLGNPLFFICETHLCTAEPPPAPASFAPPPSVPSPSAETHGLHAGKRRLFVTMTPIFFFLKYAQAKYLIVVIRKSAASLIYLSVRTSGPARCPTGPPEHGPQTAAWTSHLHRRANLIQN